MGRGGGILSNPKMDLVFSCGNMLMNIWVHSGMVWRHGNGMETWVHLEWYGDTIHSGMEA